MKKVDEKRNNSKLTEVERAYVLTLLASGMSVRSVSKAAEEHGIIISPAGVAKYRPKVSEKAAEIVEKKDDSALKRGIALKEVRVQKLAEMESLMYDSIRRRVAAGHSVDAYEFREWRGLLNDVAKEMGERSNAPAVAVQTNVNVSVNQFAGALDRTYEVINAGSAD